MLYEYRASIMAEEDTTTQPQSFYMMPVLNEEEAHIDNMYIVFGGAPLSFAIIKIPSLEGVVVSKVQISGDLKAKGQINVNVVSSDNVDSIPATIITVLTSIQSE